MNRTAHIALSTLAAGFALTGALLAFAPRPTEAAPQPLTPIAMRKERPFKIDFDYSKVDDSLFTDEVKRQIESGARLIETFIATEGEVTITVVSGDTGSAYATGAPSEYAMNTDEKSMVTAGGIRFGTKFVANARDGKGDISALTMHEILHCLGFTEGSKAVAKHLKGGMYDGPNVLRCNNNKPAPFDGAHFRRGFADKNGINPRMADGGGNTLSILDLAVLADLGYDVPLVHKRDDVDFRFPEAYYSMTQWRDGKKYRTVTGEGGNDVLEAYDYEINGKPGGYILVGGGGDDVLISGPGDDIMDGENATFRPATGKPGKNTFVLKGGGKDTIMGFQPGKDVVYISPETGVTHEALEKAIKAAKQQSAGRAGSYFPGNWVLEVDGFEVIVSTGDEDIKLQASDFKIEEWHGK